MKCTLSTHDQTAPDHATITLERSAMLVEMRGGRAEACLDCQGYYLDEAVAARVYARGDEVRRVQVAYAGLV